MDGVLVFEKVKAELPCYRLIPPGRHLDGEEIVQFYAELFDKHYILKTKVFYSGNGRSIPQVKSKMGLIDLNLGIADTVEEADRKLRETALGIAERYVIVDKWTLENRCEPKPADASK